MSPSSTRATPRAGLNVGLIPTGSHPEVGSAPTNPRCQGPSGPARWWPRGLRRGGHHSRVVRSAVSLPSRRGPQPGGRCRRRPTRCVHGRPGAPATREPSAVGGNGCGSTFISAHGRRNLPLRVAGQHRGGVQVGVVGARGVGGEPVTGGRSHVPRHQQGVTRRRAGRLLAGGPGIPGPRCAGSAGTTVSVPTCVSAEPR